MKQREKPTMLLIGLIALLCLTTCLPPEDIQDKQPSEKYPVTDMKTAEGASRPAVQRNNLNFPLQIYDMELHSVYPIYPPSIYLRRMEPYSGYTSLSSVMPDNTSSRNFLAR